MVRQNLRWLNIGVAVIVGCLLWFIWQASSSTSPELQSILARFYLSKTLFGASSAAATFFYGAGKDWTRTTHPAIFLPVSILSTTAFSLLRTLPRFLLWAAVTILLGAAAVLCFELCRIIIPFGGPLMLVNCGYICGTLIYLESEKISRSRILALELQMQADAERKRIAKDLHDEALPSLSRVMRLADQLHEEYPENSAPDEIRSRLESTVAEMRRVINDLHPAVLENLGLAAALQHLVDKLARESNIHTTFRDESAALKLPPFQALCIYRIAQEGLNNVEKHSSAANMVLSLERNQHSLILSISDDGHGNVKLKPESHGMQNIMHRARLIGARVEWKFPKVFPHGTMLMLQVPLEKESGTDSPVEKEIS